MTVALQPHLLITELVIDSERVEKEPLYNFIEVYNNTDRPFALRDFGVHLRYPSRPEFDKIWHPDEDGAAIPPGETMVFWIANAANADKTVADFNGKYGTMLAEKEQIVSLTGEMMNTKQRTVVLVTKAGREIVMANYNADALDLACEKSIVYKAPSDGSHEMVKISSQVEAPTPGEVRADQVPSQRVHIPDVEPPIRNLTSLAAMRRGEALEFIAEVEESSGTLVKQFSLFYRIGGDGEYTDIKLRKDRKDGLFRYRIEPPYLLTCDSVSYYFVAADGDKVARTDTCDVVVSAEETGLRLSVADGEVLSGRAVVRAAASDGSDPTGIQLALDGAEPLDAYSELAGDAYLMFELSGVHRMFLNTVVAGEDILHRLSYDDVVLEHASVVVPLSPETLRRYDYALAVRAGSKDRTFEDRDGVAADHFTVRDVRLVLPDGGVVRDERWSDANEIMAVGGDEGHPVSVRFRFAIPEERLRAKAAVWDTAGLADGEHRVTASAPGLGERSVAVRIDNCGPEIRTNVEEGATLRGRFRLEVEAVDTVSGVAAVQVTLDGREIAVPSEVSANELGAGVHTLHVVATDGVGNGSELRREFHVALPQQPRLLSPVEGAAFGRDEVVLCAQVGDSLGDALTVTFFQGEKLTALSGDRMRVYRGEAETEPPEEAEPAGETRLTDEELMQIGTRDDRYLTIDSVKFPYMRFEIQVAEGCGDGATVEVEWTGRTWVGRRVTMYAWHHGRADWMPLASRVAESEDDFALCGVIGVADYVRDGRANVLVQDLIAAGAESAGESGSTDVAEPRKPCDFTFILMPDSQMYSMVHPGDYDVQTNWIKDQREAMNIRYVAHVGDVVDVTEEDFQWRNASRSMQVLDDAGIPYGITTGNHDVGCGHRVSTLNYTPFCTYFGEERFKDKRYYGGSYLNNRGHYDLISAGGVDFVIVYMGWNYTTVMDDEDVAWINGVLADHRNRKAILVHHDYLGNSGERSVRGEYLYQHIVVPNANVVMTMNGHFHGSAVRVDELDDDGDGVAERRVNQISGVKGVGAPNGNLRLLHFDVAGGKVYLKTYSPTLGVYNPDEDVVLAMDLVPQVKRVATRYAEVRVFAERAIGESVRVPAAATGTASAQAGGDQVRKREQERQRERGDELGRECGQERERQRQRGQEGEWRPVRQPLKERELASGQVVEVAWKGLKTRPAGTGSYGWYVKAADSQGGVEVSGLQGLVVE